MTDRCKIGDLAIIIKDEFGCEANIGRMMHVMGPKKVSPTRGTMWVIKPVVGTTMAYIEVDGSVGFGEATNIEHKDSWLLPIRQVPEEEAFDEARDLVLPAELEAV